MRKIMPGMAMLLAGAAVFAMPIGPVFAQTVSNTESVPAAAATVLALLPADISPWSMFLAADIIVKIVLIGLALASVITWTVGLAKGVELLAAKRKAGAALTALAGKRMLSEVTAQLAGDSAARPSVQAALRELSFADGATDGVKDRIALKLERLEAAAGRRMNRGTGILATIGSTAPFVGLFGTVWGIMNSFIGISTSHTTNLAVVAPGIAEALLATAIGLAAAIPAVVIYNVFARSLATYRGLMADISAEVLQLAGRELDRGIIHLAKAAE